LPLRGSFCSEDPQCGSGDQVAVQVEDVVDGSMDANQTGFWELLVPQVVRGISLMFCYMPANMIALGSLSQDAMKNAAGLYNLMRDLGGGAAFSRDVHEPVRFADPGRCPPRHDQAAC